VVDDYSTHLEEIQEFIKQSRSQMNIEEDENSKQLKVFIKPENRRK